MQLNLKTTTVFEQNYDAYHNPNIRFIVNQGGSRSSKTYSIAQLFEVILTTEQNSVLTAVRKTFPALRATAMKDFFEILADTKIYNPESHNRSEHIYKYKSSEIEFLSVDQPQKVRGRKRKHLWINEGNELTYEDFKQLNMRTTSKVFIDYNPSDEYHWIYDHILTRPETRFIQSTYKDNPFLEASIIREIERYKSTDQNYWRIYGLGERGISEATIYNHWKFCDILPENGYELYGLDFGFNNHTALTKLSVYDDDNYFQEKLYETGLTNRDLINRMNELEISKKLLIYADSEDANRIKEIKDAGYNIKGVDKEAGSVKRGIDLLKSKGFYITKDSVNILKEVKSYKYIVKDEKPTDEPVKINDHIMDACRYAVYGHSKKKNPSIRIM